MNLADLLETNEFMDKQESYINQIKQRIKELIAEM